MQVLLKNETLVQGEYNIEEVKEEVKEESIEEDAFSVENVTSDSEVTFDF